MTQCPLVNPLCPDDLCILPAGHKGSPKVHQLGTWVEPIEVDTIFQMAYVGISVKDLIKRGWKLQEQLIEQGIIK